MGMRGERRHKAALRASFFNKDCVVQSADKAYLCPLFATHITNRASNEWGDTFSLGKEKENGPTRTVAFCGVSSGSRKGYQRLSDYLQIDEGRDSPGRRGN